MPRESDAAGPGRTGREAYDMAEGFLAKRIRRFAERLENEDVNMHGFILSAEGKTLARAYWAPFREGEPHRMYSVSKTLTGIAVGMLAEDGLLDLDREIAGFFPDWMPTGEDGYLSRLKINDMLRMATCYSATAYREGKDHNWAKAFFEGTPTHEPGTVFNYDTGASQVLAALVRRLSGREVIDLLQERLFGPLGADDKKYWLRDPSGCCTGGSGLCMSLRDLHKVGLCLLEGGRGLVPAWYVREMGRKQTDTSLMTSPEERYGYGWQCWRTRAGFAMYGMGGQLSAICPEKNAVLSTIADTRLDPFGVQRIYDAFFEEVWPYLGTEDTEEISLSRPAVRLKDDAAVPLPGRGEYRFARGNALGLETVSFDGLGCLRLRNASGEGLLSFRRGESGLVRWPGRDDVPAVLSAAMLSPGLLRLRCFAVGDSPCGFDMVLHFGRDWLTVRSRASSDPELTAGWDGTASGIRTGTAGGRDA